MFFEEKPDPLDAEIDRLARELRMQMIGSDKYHTVLDTISKLNALKAEQQSQKISKEKWLMAGTNILGILLIINHERVNHISTQAMSLLNKKI